MSKDFIEFIFVYFVLYLFEYTHNLLELKHMCLKYIHYLPSSCISKVKFVGILFAFSINTGNGRLTDDAGMMSPIVFTDKPRCRAKDFINKK